MPGPVPAVSDADSAATDATNLKTETALPTDAHLVPMELTRPELLDLDQHPWNS